MAKEPTNKFDEKINLDTATTEKIDTTNEKLVDYLNDSGDVVAAEQVQGLINAGKSDSKKIGKSNPINSKLLKTNNEILSVLEKIYRDMNDEQDTEIKSVKRMKRKAYVASATVKESEIEDEEDDSEFGLPDLGRRRGRKGAKGKGKGKGRGRGGRGRGKSTGKGAKGGRGAAKTSNARRMNRGADGRFKAAPKKIPKVSTGAMAKLGKGAMKFARFAGPVGLALGVGMAAYDAYDGWNNAGEALGINDKDLSTTNKAASAGGSLISGLTFGLADSDNLSQGINNTFGGNSTLDRFINAGIIDHDLIGNSEIDDWRQLSELSASDIQKIIDINDWSDDDLKRMEALKGLVNTKIPKKSTGSSSDIPADTEFQKVSYTMKNVTTPTSGAPTNNPSDFSANELFKLNGVNEMDISGLDPNVQSNLKAMAAEYFDEYGEKMQINSAYRSFAEQARMKEKFGSKAASPGMSMHNYGLAVDLNTSDVEKAIKAGLFHKYGFTRPVSGETWHVEPAGINRKAIREMGMKDGDSEAKKYAEGQTGSTRKTSDLTSVAEGEETEMTVSEKNDVNPETAKALKESMTEQNSQNLSSQTSSYDRGSVDIAQTSVNPILAPNINNRNGSDNESERILNHFS